MNRDEFKTLLNKINVSLEEQQLNQLDKYFEILVAWNEFMNLTAITDYDEVLVKHFVDSLAVQKAIVDMYGGKLFKEEDNPTLIDVGTGAGFPGLPLKIAFPELKVTLLDSLNKRIKFLNEVVDKLELVNTETIHSRAEDGARNVALRENFHIGVSRAVANLSTLVEYVFPYVKVGGYFIAYKSGDVDNELESAKKAVSILGGEIENVYKFTIPDTDIERSFVFIKKVKNTPKKYPRKAGIPSKEPLGA